MAKKIKVNQVEPGPVYDAEGKMVAYVPEKKPIYKKWWFWVLAVLLLIILISAIGGGSSDEKVAESSNASSSSEVEEEEEVEEIVNESNYTIDDLEVRQGDDGEWYAFAGNEIAKGYNGLARNSKGMWFIRDGKVNFQENMEYTSGDRLYVIQNGQVVEEYVEKGGDYQKVEKSQFRVGETFTFNGKTIKFVSANPNFTNYNPYATVPGGYKVLEVVFDFANNGDTDFLYTSGDLDCYADNEKCETFYYVNSGASFFDTLSPGRTASGQKTYFLIPENASSIVCEYETNWWTQNKIEFIVK